ncbi:hypothetical protein AB0H28_14290 [Micromonospora sp. NPDC050980]|uniref:hypothetical protein n=1 Tax=Micromonospora sp. NPDC050980 TaxID=3155161 RepID=UPI0033D4D5A6
MPRHPDTIIAPNTLLTDARKSLQSPHRRGQYLSRAELADAVNNALQQLHPGRDMTFHYVDFRWIGKLERGEHRWPSDERRKALRHVLKAAADRHLGLFSPRRSGEDASAWVPTSPALRSAPDEIEDKVAEALATGYADAAGPWLRDLDCLTAQPSISVTPELSRQVRQNLEVLDRLQRDGQRPHLAAADARWSEFMSWIADNVGDSAGGAWLERCQRRATEIEDQVLIAYALMRGSQRSLDDGDVRSAIDLARRSLTHVPAAPRVRVLCLTRLAEGLAAGGVHDTSAVIAEAHRELRYIGHDGADKLARHCDPRYVRAVDARCRQLLGDLLSAVSIFEELIGEDRTTPSLDVGMWHTYLGECYLHNDPEQAAAHGMQALRLAREARSYRVIRASQPLAIAVRRHGSLTSVRAFVDAHRSAVQDQ